MNGHEKNLVELLTYIKTVSADFSAQVCLMLASTKPSIVAPRNNHFTGIEILVLGVATH
jgi:hypothetical protein